jgi:hypothetical protein
VVTLADRHPNLKTLLLTGMEQVGRVGFERLRGLACLERVGFLGASRLDTGVLENYLFSGSWVEMFVLCKADFWDRERAWISKRSKGRRVRWLESQDVVCEVFE